MILYSLQCGNGHVFDEWFASGADYEAKAKARDIACPDCGGTDVRKAIMAPNVSRGAAAAAPASACATCGEAGGCPWSGEAA